MFQLFECIGTWLRPTKLNVLLYWRIICNSLFFFAISEKLLMKRRWSLAKPRYVFDSLRLVSVGKSSVNDFYFTWARPSGVTTHSFNSLFEETTFHFFGFNFPLMSRIARNYKFFFVEKSRPQRFFALYDFPLLLRFSHLPEVASELYILCKKLRKIGTTTILCNVLFLFLIGFSRFLDGANSAKMAKNRCQED